MKNEATSKGHFPNFPSCHLTLSRRCCLPGARNHCFISVKLDSFPWQRSVDVKNKCNFSLSSRTGRSRGCQLSLAMKCKSQRQVISTCVCSDKPETWFPRACHLILCQDEVCPVSLYRCVSARTGFGLGVVGTMVFVSSFSGSIWNLCFFLPNRWTPSAMAIAVVLGWDSRIYSGSDYHEGLRNGFHVRLLASSPRTRSSKSSTTFF